MSIPVLFFSFGIASIVFSLRIFLGLNFRKNNFSGLKFRILGLIRWTPLFVVKLHLKIGMPGDSHDTSKNPKMANNSPENQKITSKCCKGPIVPLGRHVFFRGG